MRRSKKKDFSKVIKKQNKSWFHRLVSGAFLAPSVLGVLLFFVLPFLVVIYFSFVNNPVAKKFVGLTNYINHSKWGIPDSSWKYTIFFGSGSAACRDPWHGTRISAGCRHSVKK